MKRRDCPTWPLAAFPAAIAALLLLAGSPAAGAEAKGKPPAAKHRPKPKTHKVTRGAFRVEVRLTGVFESTKKAEIALSPEAWTQLRVLKAVEHGAAVKKGQQLLWLDLEKIDREIKTRTEGLATWEVTVKQAEEELRLLEKTTPEKLAQAVRDQQRAAQDLERFTKIDRPLAEKDAANTLRYRADVLDYTREELRQLEKMYKADDLTEETEEIVLRRQRDAVRRAEFALEKAKVDHEKQMKVVLPRQAEDLAAAAKGKDEARKNAETVLPLALRKKRLETAKTRRDAAKAAEHLAKLKRDRAAMVVKAPMAGRVYYGRCVRGKWTGAEKVAPKLVRGGLLTADLVFMTVVEPKLLRVRAVAAEKQLHRLGKGLKGKATPAGYPGRKLDVQIESILTAPVSPGQFDAKLSVAGDPGPVQPGMTCTVTLGTVEKKDAIAVPAAAVHTDPANPKERFVYLKTPGKPQKRVVKVGRTHDGRTEILEGLTEGEIVLLEAPQ